MGTRDSRVDDYIGKAASFAQPLLTQVRELVHVACPTVEETIKWGVPHYMYQGILCQTAAFKQHCALRFWKGEVLFADTDGSSPFGPYGKLTSLRDLPPKREFVQLVKRAMAINEAGTLAPSQVRARARSATSRQAAAPVIVPPVLAAALARSERAAGYFATLSPSHRREYVEWIDEAKREDTKLRRVEQAIEMLEDARTRNWKYERRSQAAPPNPRRP